MTISIIIPHYNHTRALAKCLNSIAAQTWRDFEIIIVDDGSGEAERLILQKMLRSYGTNHGTTQEEARFYGTDREMAIRIIWSKHRGANVARNTGAAEARGEYLLFCDADIIMRPDMLEIMMKTLEAHPAAAYAYSSFRFGWKIFHLWPFDETKLKQNNFIHTTSLLRREHFPGFDEKITRLQDWDLWLTILKRGGWGIWIPEILFKVILHHKGKSFWLPSFFYKIPWLKFGIRIAALQDFNQAKKIILEKHKLF